MRSSPSCSSHLPDSGSLALSIDYYQDRRAGFTLHNSQLWDEKEPGLTKFVRLNRLRQKYGFAYLLSHSRWNGGGSGFTGRK